MESRALKHYISLLHIPYTPYVFFLHLDLGIAGIPPRFHVSFLLFFVHRLDFILRRSRCGFMNIFLPFFFSSRRAFAIYVLFSFFICICMAGGWLR